MQKSGRRRKKIFTTESTEFSSFLSVTSVFSVVYFREEDMNAQPLEPILVAELFPEMRSELLQLLRSLSEAEWDLPTVCAGWSVKDIALHLLGDDIGVLSGRRDGFRLNAAINGWDELVAFINNHNDLWVRAARRMSPRVLCDLLAVAGDMLYRYFASLDPYAPGGVVSWAGPEPAPVWFEIAREYTEHWMHQQQIRDAVGRPGLKTRRFFAPLLDTFVRALPHTFRAVEAPAGTLVKLMIPGEAGGAWHLVREDERWKLYRDTDLRPACTVTVDAETAWRLFTKGIDKESARARAHIEGDEALGIKALDTVSIIA